VSSTKEDGKVGEGWRRMEKDGEGWRRMEKDGEDGPSAIHFISTC
jgi:hypothetical protein